MRSTTGRLSILNYPFLALAAKASAETYEMPGWGRFATYLVIRNDCTRMLAHAIPDAWLGR